MQSGWSGTTETWESHYTGQFDFYVQNVWGAGLMLRREFTPNFGLNIIGVVSPLYSKAQTNT